MIPRKSDSQHGQGRGLNLCDSAREGEQDSKTVNVTSQHRHRETGGQCKKEMKTKKEPKSHISKITISEL